MICSIHKLTLSLILLTSISIGSVTIAIQPLGEFDSTLYPEIISAINEVYPGCIVEIRTTAPVPSTAFYEPRNRYRAEKILVHLDSITPTGYDKVVGLLEKDISTTKGEYYDWGIFGLGNLADKSCVVSTFRLRKAGVSDALYKERILKLVIHELGHTFGLDHCSNTQCILTDACGKISTIDSAKRALCERCNSHIEMVFMLL